MSWIGAGLSLGAAASQLIGGGKSEVGNNVRVEPWTRYTWSRSQHNVVQDRVADAKRAGIHPLYALGISGNPGGQNIYADPRPTGRPGKGRRLAESLLSAGQAAVLFSEAKRNTAQASYYNSQAARATQESRAMPTAATTAIKGMVDRIMTETSGTVGRPKAGKHTSALGIEYPTRAGWTDSQHTEDKVGEVQKFLDDVDKAIVMRLDKIGVRGETAGKTLHDFARLLKLYRRIAGRDKGAKERGARQKKAMRRHLRSREASKFHNRFYRFGDY